MGAGASAAPPSLRSLTSRKGSRVPKQWWIESEKCIISDAFLIISTLSLFFPGNAISLIRPEFCQRHGYCNSSGFAFYRQESHCFWNKEYSFFFFFFLHSSFTLFLPFFCLSLFTAFVILSVYLSPAWRHSHLDWCLGCPNRLPRWFLIETISRTSSKWMNQ